MITKEEIADKYSDYGKLHNGQDCFVLEYTNALLAMEEYYQRKTKEIEDQTENMAKARYRPPRKNN